jgi:hypothetical protein
MRSPRMRYSILLLLALAPILLNACAFGSGSSDPPVTPDTTIPPTLQVTASITEDQDASDGMYGSSEVTLQFSTNEVTETNTVIFTHGETLYCYFNNHQRSFALGSATSYSFHVAISSLPFTYKCDYHYFLNGQPKAGNIFIFNSPHYLLSPVLQRPVGNNSNFKVIYHPSNPSPNVKTCTIQVTANAPNGSVNGDTLSQDGNTYTGPDVSSLNGLGNIVMTRTCTPIHIVDGNNNSAECGCPPDTKFAAVNVTYTSTASNEVSWVPPSTPSQSTTS